MIAQYQQIFLSKKWYENFSKTHPIESASILDRANELLSDRIKFNDPMDMEPYDIPVQLSDFVWNKSPNGDDEWLFMLSRHAWLVDLAMAYRITGDCCYVEKAKELLFRFIYDNEDVSVNPTMFRPLDVGLRLLNWVKALTYLPLDFLNKDDELTLKKMIVTQAEYLRDSYVTKYDLSNWGVLALGGIVISNLAYPSLLDENIVSWAEKLLKIQFQLQFDDYGWHWEQSPLYQHEVIMVYLYLKQFATATQQSLELVELKQAVHASYYMATIEDMLLPLNDSDRVDFGYIYDLYRAHGLLLDSPVKNLARNKLYYGDLPLANKEDVVLPAFFQTTDFIAYKTEKSYLTVSCSWHGSGHGHASIGSLHLEIENTPILTDSGRLTYKENHSRRLLKSEPHHNCLGVWGENLTAINGSWTYERLPQPLALFGKETPFGFYAQLSFMGRDKHEKLAVLTRHIFWLEKSQKLILVDSLEGSHSSHKLVSYFNSPSEISIMSSSRLTVSSIMYSSTYNQECYGYHYEAITDVVQNYFSCQVTVIGNDIEKLSFPKAYQTDSSTPYIFSNGVCLGDFKAYVIHRDVVSGQKLMKDDQGLPFYGRVLYQLEDGSYCKLL